MEPRELLQHHYLFRDLSDDVLDRLSAMAHLKSLPAKQTIFLRGDEGGSLFGVLKGEVKVCASTPGGKETVFGYLGAGDVLGEIALLDGRERDADAFTTRFTRMIEIRRGPFAELMSSEPQLAIHMVNMMCARVREFSERIEDYSILDSAGRLAKLILGEAKRHGRETKDGLLVDTLPYQGEIARMIGTSRISVNKHLQCWKREGILSVKRRSFTILDEDGLGDIVRCRMEE
ncbi:MAG: Crp/Fnr family transcriptional regulator [Gammaproteobacteria bacterium]